MGSPLYTQDVYNTKNTIVRFEAFIEDTPPNFEESDLPKILEDIESGKLVYFCAKVSVLIGGMEYGNDYLGGCCYESFESFTNEYKFDYFEDMVKAAIAESRNEIAAIKYRLSTFKPL